MLINLIDQQTFLMHIFVYINYSSFNILGHQLCLWFRFFYEKIIKLPNPIFQRIIYYASISSIQERFNFFYVLQGPLKCYPVIACDQTIFILFSQYFLLLMSRCNRLKLRPLSNEEYKYLTPQNNQDRSFKQLLSKPPLRFKTQGDQNASIFPLSLSVGRRHATSQKDPRKQYELFRQMQLRKEFQSNRQYKKKRGVKLFRPSKDPVNIVSKIEEKFESITFKEELVEVKSNDLTNNILHLARLFTVLLKRGQTAEVIECIKLYILEEESDLSNLQLGAVEEKTQHSIKQVIYYERLLLLLLVQSFLTRKFKSNEALFHQICKDFTHFYSLVYHQVNKQPLSTFLLDNNHKFLSQYATTLSPFSLFSIKDRIAKKVNNLSHQFVDFDRFIAAQLSKIKTLPTNLLYYNLLQFYAGRLVGQDWLGWGIQFLQTCPSPYLHHPTSNKYTLLLDLDETLVHYRIVNTSKGEFLLRPHLFEFLKALQSHFQVGVFTCALKEYADIILEHLPVISVRLYRQHAVKIGKELVKDLSRVGRDLSKTILVDNLQKNFKLQKQNGIHVRSWFGDPNDNVLKELQTELQGFIRKNPHDVRESEHRRSFL